MKDALELLPGYLANHLYLSMLALTIGVGLSLVLSLVSIRVRSLQGPLLAFASTIQTIPALALLALMVPLLGRIGVVPALVALILYSMLPVLRNAITGLEGVDANLVRAGTGLGMRPDQILWRIQLPLALPVIVAGIRTACIWVVGMTTLSTPVGATSLGNFIFAGLQTQNHAAVLVGCVSVALLALSIDGVIRWIELSVRRRNNRGAALGIVAILVLTALGVAPRFAGGADGRPVVRLGGKTFTEQYILVELLANRLEAAGFRVDKVESLGSAVVFDALAAGYIDCYVDYSGTIWANHMKREDNPGAEQVLEEVSEWLRGHDIHLLGALGFENAYALAMRGDRARELGATSIADLRRHAGGLVVGGDYEFFQRPEWRAVREAYGLTFREETSFDSTLMYRAVAEGEVDVISAFSTDGRIAGFELTLLADPRGALPPYDAVLLLSAAAATDPELVGVLEVLIGEIGDELMRTANMWVDVDGLGIGLAAERLDTELDSPESPEIPEINER